MGIRRLGPARRGKGDIRQPDEQVSQEDGPEKTAIAGENNTSEGEICGEQRTRRKPQAASSQKKHQQSQTPEPWLRGKRKASRWQRRLFRDGLILIHARRRKWSMGA